MKADAMNTPPPNADPIRRNWPLPPEENQSGNSPPTRPQRRTTAARKRCSRKPSIWAPGILMPCEISFTADGPIHTPPLMSTRRSTTIEMAPLTDTDGASAALNLAIIVGSGFFGRLSKVGSPHASHMSPRAAPVSLRLLASRAPARRLSPWRLTRIAWS